MPKLSVLQVMMFLPRIGLAMLFVLVMTLMFFSFRVELKENSMERFVFELSDAISSDTNLVAAKSLFSPDKLDVVEKGDIESYAQNCDFGYQVDIESRSPLTLCESDDGCRGFCGEVCGIDSASLDMGVTGNCNCNLEIGNDFCECRKTPQSAWQNNYRWRLGYKPSSLRETASTFPAGIEAPDNALPAMMKITAYDSLLTRLSCTSAKAFRTKEKFTTKFSTNQLPAGTTGFRRSGTDGTHVCLYKGDEPLEGECRYLPGIPVGELNILAGILSNAGANTWAVTAYPIKSSAACPPDASDIAGPADTVGTVLLCLEESS